MSRRNSGSSILKTINPDPKYGSILVERLTNKLMYDGKKATMQRIVWDALESASTNLNTSPVEALSTALNNITPISVLRSIKVGGASHQVPVPATERIALNWAFRFLIDAARNRGENTLTLALSNEICDAYNRKGMAVKSFEEHRKRVDANKAFARV